MLCHVMRYDGLSSHVMLIRKKPHLANAYATTSADRCGAHLQAFGSFVAATILLVAVFQLVHG